MNLKALNIKVKITLFLIAYVIIILLSFRLAFSKTVSLKRQIKQYSTTINNAMTNENIRNLDIQIEQLTKELNGINSKTEIVHEQVLKTISDLCNDYSLLIYKYPQAQQYPLNEYLMVIHQIEITGDFISMVKLLYSLEKDFGGGQIISAYFYLDDESRLRNRSLILRIYVQNIENYG